jgi:type VI secretion system secreted protein Hcp
MDRVRASAKTLALIAVAILVAAGTYAVASIPDSGGVVTACWYHVQDGTTPFGTLRLIDPSLAGTGATTDQYSCRSTETQVTWNQQGPTGPSGPAGPQGADGAQGAQGAAPPLTLLSFGARGNTIFLSIAGIEGESKDAKHKGDIELRQVSLGGGDTSKAHTGEFKVLKLVDKSSPALFKACATGTHYKKVSISMRKAGKGQQDYLRFTLTNVLISAVNGASPSGGKPAEQLTLTFGKLGEQFLGNHHSGINLTPNQFAGG